jgi:hypothetical protein
VAVKNKIRKWNTVAPKNPRKMVGDRPLQKADLNFNTRNPREVPEQVKPKDFDAEMRNAGKMQRQFTRKLEKKMFGVGSGDQATPELLPKKKKCSKKRTSISD